MDVHPSEPEPEQRRREILDRVRDEVRLGYGNRALADQPNSVLVFVAADEDP